MSWECGWLFFVFSQTLALTPLRSKCSSFCGSKTENLTCFNQKPIEAQRSANKWPQRNALTLKWTIHLVSYIHWFIPNGRNGVAASSCRPLALGQSFCPLAPAQRSSRAKELHARDHLGADLARSPQTPAVRGSPRLGVWVSHAQNER